MSELIVEMEMPKSCPCDLTNGDTPCFAAHGIPKRWADFEKHSKLLHTRPWWCPIKGVLPDEHGDLIDTSTVVGSIKRETDIHDVTLKEYLGFKFPVQTIVPIDEFLENRKTIPIIVAAERKDDEQIH